MVELGVEVERLEEKEQLERDRRVEVEWLLQFYLSTRTLPLLCQPQIFPHHTRQHNIPPPTSYDMTVMMLSIEKTASLTGTHIPHHQPHLANMCRRATNSAPPTTDSENYLSDAGTPETPGMR